MDYDRRERRAQAALQARVGALSAAKQLLDLMTDGGASDDDALICVLPRIRGQPTIATCRERIQATEEAIDEEQEATNPKKKKAKTARSRTNSVALFHGVFDEGRGVASICNPLSVSGYDPASRVVADQLSQEHTCFRWRNQTSQGLSRACGSAQWEKVKITLGVCPGSLCSNGSALNAR